MAAQEYRRRPGRTARAPAEGLSCSEYRPRARPVQVRASHRITVFDVAQCNVAPVAKQSAHALAARPVLHRAALVVVVHMDELPLREQLAAHPAGISLQFFVHALRVSRMSDFPDFWRQEFENTVGATGFEPVTLRL